MVAKASTCCTFTFVIRQRMYVLSRNTAPTFTIIYILMPLLTPGVPDTVRAHPEVNGVRPDGKMDKHGRWGVPGMTCHMPPC